MYKLFGILLLSLLFTSILIVPFINLLYNLRFRQKHVRTVNAKGQRAMHQWKVGTPIGGGILVIISLVLFSALFYFLTDYMINWTTLILLLTLTLFGALGLYDDLRKFFKFGKRKIRVLPAWTKFMLQAICGLTIGYFLYTYMGLQTLSFPLLGPLLQWEPLHLGWIYIPMAAAVIISSSNAFNITDGLDGLSTGLLLIALAAFWYLTTLSPFGGDVALFIAVLIGALLPYLYFNIYPARLWLGDTGALAFGAMLAVIALMIGQVLVLPFIGGMFVIEGASSLIQIIAKRFFGGRKVFKIAPLHHHFEAVGWDETKVTMRFWLAGIVLAWIGLFVATFG
jgi:phospho-N-acetylmuramoyl-pentapeptide-transferase